jgi:hypothetical protein
MMNVIKSSPSVIVVFHSDGKRRGYAYGLEYSRPKLQALDQQNPQKCGLASHGLVAF